MVLSVKLCELDQGAALLSAPSVVAVPLSYELCLNTGTIQGSSDPLLHLPLGKEAKGRDFNFLSLASYYCSFFAG